MLLWMLHKWDTHFGYVLFNLLFLWKYGFADVPTTYNRWVTLQDVMDKNFDSRFPNDALDINRSIVVMDVTANVMDVTLSGSK